MMRSNILAGVVTLFISCVIVNCSNNEVDLQKSPKTPKQLAIDSISKVLSSGLERVISNSELMSVTTPNLSTLNLNQVSRFMRTETSIFPLVYRIVSHVARNKGLISVYPFEENKSQEEIEDELTNSENIELLLEPWLRYPLFSKDAIIYRPDTNLLCNEIGDNNLCHQVLSEIAIVQTMQDEKIGRLDIRLFEFNPISIGYSGNQVYFEQNLEDSLSALIHLIAMQKNTQSSPPLLSSLEIINDTKNSKLNFEGIYRIAITTLDQEGVTGVRFSIVKPIDIKIPHEEGLLSEGIYIASSDYLVDLELNSTNKAIRVKFDMNQLVANYLLFDDMKNQFMAELTVAGFIGTIEWLLNDNLNIVNVKDLNMGELPVSLSIKNNEVLTLSTLPLNYTWLPKENLMFFESEFSLDFDAIGYHTLLKKQQTAIESTYVDYIKLSINENTEIQKDLESNQFQLNAGRIEVEGNTLVNSPEIFEKEECFLVNISSADYISKVDC